MNVAELISIGELFGGFLNPILSGIAADTFGQGAPLVISSCAAILAFVFSIFIKETAPAKLQTHTEEVEHVA